LLSVTSPVLYVQILYAIFKYEFFIFTQLIRIIRFLLELLQLTNWNLHQFFHNY
jgi:hypothetical protein